jgi:hypothetical protein
MRDRATLDKAAYLHGARLRPVIERQAHSSERFSEFWNEPHPLFPRRCGFQAPIADVGDISDPKAAVSQRKESRG